ncbi:hypothetical protein PoB_004522400 [Plakobranchus ocellatus]|uniref:ShKT domain-containing protein n=1 Tax=Plakobranchus ocellatus TaxID=259542 RepID=A0AAV4BK87_9GAST|nr:hypothetical protein PoB_004522400 [Plakobranchus ocellatus]
MKATAVLSLLALMAYIVTATPCADICNAQCDLRKQTCKFIDVFGILCETQNEICTKACDAACGCVDTCAKKCGGEYASCKGEGKALLGIYSCGLNLTVCTSTCHTKCNFKLYSTIVTSITTGSKSLLKFPKFGLEDYIKP